MSGPTLVIDTSALLAILNDESKAELCQAALLEAEALFISADTLCEALIVAGQRKRLPDLQDLIEVLQPVVMDVTRDSARQVAEAYLLWGKGNHPAKLNFGDCFAYVLAKQMDCPLLFVGSDFSKTDVKTAIPGQ